MLQQWKNLSVTLGAVMCGALLTGVVMSWPQRLNQQARADARVALSAAAEENLKHAEGLSAAFRYVSDALHPSVVSISAEATPRLARGQGSLPPELRRQLPPWLGDDFLRQFEGQQGGAPQPRQSGMGSGVVIRADGYLLTNNHVVEGAETLKVQLSDGRKLDAKVIGTDPATDLAVLKVEATGLQAAVLGDSEAVQVGDWVVAIGSPFGLDQTVTAGIISGKHRVQGIVGGGNGFEDFLQTDAAINPGNSGGPLVNLRGEVIGINTAILSRSGASAGIGFAIPMGLAQPVIDSIIESGSVRRGFLGAQVGDITPEVKSKFDLKVDAGALISGVLDGQPAAEAGLLPGDVVTEMDGKPVASGTQLRNYIASRKPGSSVKIKVSRNGSALDMQVNLRERTDKAMAMFEGGDAESGDLVIGARLKPLTEEQARELNLQGPAVGLLVTELEDDGLAAQAQLRVGDVIEEAGGQTLTTVEQFRSILEEQQKAGRGLKMVIRRGNVRVLLMVR
jgi:serine protease Do